jgi:hypothetical protein
MPSRLEVAMRRLATGYAAELKAEYVGSNPTVIDEFVVDMLNPIYAHIGEIMALYREKGAKAAAQQEERERRGG